MFKLFIIIILNLILYPTQVIGNDKDERTFINKLWGHSPESVFYFGMWTYHFKDDGKANWNNHAYGLEANGYFFSTMRNTYHQQCYTAGISRHWAKKKINENFAIAIGYRFGGIYGYDKELKSIANIAEKYKILPYGQIYSHFIYKRLRFELSYINQLISFHFAVLWKKF